MGVWQRGAGGSASIAVPASTIAYTTDRWYIQTNANQAYTVSQQASGVTGTRYGCRVQRNSGQTGTTVVIFAQPFDSDMILALAGRTVVVSVNITTGANWSPASGMVQGVLYMGTGAVTKRGQAAYTGETNLSGSVNVAAGTAQANYTLFSGAIPSNTTQMELQFQNTPVGAAGANDWFQITNVQLEIGSVATAFDAERQNFIDELARCQRFYEKSFPYGTAPVQNVGNENGAACYTFVSNISQAWNLTSIYKVVKRATPTIITFNPRVANANWRDVGGVSDIAYSTTNISDSSVILGAASTTNNSTHFIHYALDAEI